MAEEYKRTREVWDASDSHAGEQNEDIWSWRAVVVDGGMSGGVWWKMFGKRKSSWARKHIPERPHLYWAGK